MNLPKNKFYVEAIVSLTNADVVIEQDDNGNILSTKFQNENITLPSQSIIDAKMLKLQNAYNAKQYQRDRVYPSIGEQLDMLWHSIDRDGELKSKYYDFYEAIKAVKVKNPK
jgi:hypothetical protein